MYHLITHQFPEEVSGIPFSKLERAAMPGIEVGDDVWSRFDLRLPLVDEALLEKLEELLSDIYTVPEDRFLDLRREVISAGIDERWADFLDPGVQFGKPTLKVLRPKIWFDLYHEVCSERFRDLILESGLTGLSFQPLEFKGKKPSVPLYLVEAEFSNLAEGDQRHFEAANPNLRDRQTRRMEEVVFSIPGGCDFYRAPYMYSGLLVSDAGREFIEANGLDVGIKFGSQKVELGA